MKRHFGQRRRWFAEFFEIFYFLFAGLECPRFRCLPALTFCCCCCARCTQLRIASISAWLTFASLSLSSVCLCVMFYNISSNVYSHHHNVGLHVNFLGRLFRSQHHILKHSENSHARRSPLFGWLLLFAFAALALKPAEPDQRCRHNDFYFRGISLT